MNKNMKKADIPIRFEQIGSVLESLDGRHFIQGFSEKGIVAITGVPKCDDYFLCGAMAFPVSVIDETKRGVRREWVVKTLEIIASHSYLSLEVLKAMKWSVRLGQSLIFAGHSCFAKSRKLRFV
jgi:hypothetical protein